VAILHALALHKSVFYVFYERVAAGSTLSHQCVLVMLSRSRPRGHSQHYAGTVFAQLHAHNGHAWQLHALLLGDLQSDINNFMWMKRIAHNIRVIPDVRTGSPSCSRATDIRRIYTKSVGQI